MVGKIWREVYIEGAHNKPISNGMRAMSFVVGGRGGNRPAAEGNCRLLLE